MTPTMHAADPKEGTVATDPYLWLEEVDGDRAIAWARSAERAHAEPSYRPTRAIRASKPRHAGSWKRETGSPTPSWWGAPSITSGRTTNMFAGCCAARTGLRLRHWFSQVGDSARRRCAVGEGRQALGHGGARLSRTGIPALSGYAVEWREGRRDRARVRHCGQAVRRGRIRACPRRSTASSGPIATRCSSRTDWGDGSLTESGYPYIVKRWKRGQPLGSATESSAERHATWRFRRCACVTATAVT